MKRFYVTFGSSKVMPYGRGEYVMVIADNELSARRLFQAAHPNPEDDNVMNCADIYTEEQWKRIAQEYYADKEPVETIAMLISYANQNRPNYDRMSEIASLALDGLVDDGKAEAIEYARDTIDMSDAEMEYFGLDAVEDELESEASA